MNVNYSSDLGILVIKSKSFQFWELKFALLICFLSASSVNPDHLMYFRFIGRLIAMVSCHLEAFLVKTIETEITWKASF